MRKVGAFLFGYLGPRRAELGAVERDDVDYRQAGQVRPRSGRQVLDG